MAFTKINHYEHEYADTHRDTALNVAEGVADQPIVNPYLARRRKRALTTEAVSYTHLTLPTILG